MAGRLAGAWKVVLPALLLLLLVMLVLAPDYGDAQTAVTADDFRAVVSPGERGRYTAAAIVDLVFAASYAALAVSLALRVDRREPSPRVLGGFARAASALVVVGAVLDEVENARLLRNIADYHSLTNDAVREVARLGPIKDALGYGGSAVVVLCLAAARFLSPERRGGRSVKLEDAATFLTDRAERISTKRRRAALVVAAVLTLVLVGYIVAGRPQLRNALVAGIGVHACVWVLRTLWEAELASIEPHPWRPAWVRVRRLAMIAIPVAAAAVAAYFAFGRDNRGIAAYIGGVGAYIAVGITLRRWRASEERDPRWGTWILTGATAVALVSLLVATVTVSGRPLFGVLVAVLVFPMGIALVAEDHADSGPTGQVRVAWGVAAVLAGMVGLALARLDPYELLLVTVALVVIVALIASNTSHDVVLVLVVIALIWSLEPQRGPKEPDPAPGKPTIVALGDSYMSGEGARTYYRGTNHNHGDDDRNECRRAPTAYPIVARDLLAERGEEYEVLFLACSGAKADQLTDDAQYSDEPTSPWSNRGEPPGDEGVAQLEQARQAINERDLRPELVLVSIGGNDAGFGEIGMTCGLAGDCSALGARWLESLEKTRAEVSAAYAKIKATEELQGARVLVIPYPVPINESGCDASLLRPNEHRFIVGFTRALDRVLEEEAEAAGFDYLARGVDIFRRGRVRVCDVPPSKAAVNQLAASPVAAVFLQQVSPRGWFHNTFHPNKRGHERLAREIADAVVPPRDPPGQPDPSDAPMRLGGIMGAGFDHCGSEDRVPATCHTDRGAWVIASVTRVLWAVAVPVALVVLGALLLSMELIRRWPRRRGNDEAPADAP